LGSLINPDGVGKRRDRLTKAAVLALRALAGHKRVNDETRDLVAFLAMTLKQVDETIDETCRAWEKRDYWIKADQFRQQWAWTVPTAAKFEAAVLENKWQLIPQAVPELAQRLANVSPPKRIKDGAPWQGAYAHLLEKRVKSKPTDHQQSSRKMN
jgi:hypothetical protein